VLLGLGADGQPLTVSGKQLMHVALAGATGSGKTNTARLVVAQILAVGGRVVVANPHWTSYDAESGDDWRAIERRLHLAPAVKPADIADLLRWLVHDEMERRLERKRAGELPGEGITLYVDELPAIVDEVPDAAKMLGKILRQGRALRMYLVGASQDFLTKTIGSSSGVREAYRTAFYSGGDLTGARSLLDIRQNEIEEHRLGQGVVYLRSSATSPARLVRVPLASNEGIHRLLTDDQPTMERVVGGDTVVSGGVSTPADDTPRRTADGQPMDSAADTARSRLSVQGERVRQAIAEGLSQSDTIRRVWGCEPSTREGQKATREYRAILAEIARAVGE
jgi:DNA segregation ATPase FtsK/SpoIIIE-like protein